MYCYASTVKDLPESYQLTLNHHNFLIGLSIITGAADRVLGDREKGGGIRESGGGIREPGGGIREQGGGIREKKKKKKKKLEALKSLRRSPCCNTLEDQHSKSNLKEL